MELITSVKNGVIQRFHTLVKDRKERRAQGLAVLEGIRLTEEALQSGVELVQVLVCPSRLSGERAEQLVAALAAAGVPIADVAEAPMDKATDTVTPQGVAALFRPRVWGLADLLARREQGSVVALDGLGDPGNLGTIVRTAEALGAAGLLLGPGTVDPYSPKVVRAAMGSLFRLPLVQVADLAAALAELRAAGLRAYAAEAAGSQASWAADLAAPGVLVIGNEAHGVSPATLAACDGRVRVPMPGPAESLNAAMAAGLLLYEALRQRSGR
jgi:TrmH family RNA methyltransferase